MNFGEYLALKVIDYYISMLCLCAFLNLRLRAYFYFRD